MKRQMMGYLQITIAMFIVGSSVVAGKLLVQEMPIFLASALRFFIATIILVPLLLRQEKQFSSIHFKDLCTLFLQAFTGVFLFNVLMLHGLQYTTAMEAGIVTSTLPAVIGLVSFLFLQERLTFKKGLGITLAVMGVFLMNNINMELGNKTALAGNLFILGAVLGETIFITLGKLIATRLTPLTITTIISIFGLIMFLPFAIYEATAFKLSSVGIWEWMTILYFGIIVTVVAFLFMYRGLAEVSASSAGILTSVIPLSSVTLSFFILREQLFINHLVGMGFIVMAIFLMSKVSLEQS